MRTGMRECCSDCDYAYMTIFISTSVTHNLTLRELEIKTFLDGDVDLWTL